MDVDIKCPMCAGERVVKNGAKRGKQSYKCMDCKHQFVEDALPPGRPLGS